MVEKLTAFDTSGSALKPIFLQKYIKATYLWMYRAIWPMGFVPTTLVRVQMRVTVMVRVHWEGVTWATNWIIIFSFSNICNYALC